MSANVPKGSPGKGKSTKQSPKQQGSSPTGRPTRETPKIPPRPVGTTGQKRVTGTPGDGYNQRTERRGSTENMMCCGPPASNPFLPCQEIKRTVNYGSRPEIPAREPCEHIQVNNPNCERCCKTITLNKYIVSLHCGWHHDCLRCSWCKATLEDDHRVYRGMPYCVSCHARLRGDHASEMRTVHKSNQ